MKENPVFLEDPMCLPKGSNEKTNVGKERKETDLSGLGHTSKFQFQLSPTSYINTGNHLTFMHYFICLQIGHCPQGTYIKFIRDNKAAKTA